MSMDLELEYVMSYCVMLWYVKHGPFVMLCCWYCYGYAMLCYVMLCYGMVCNVIIICYGDARISVLLGFPGRVDAASFLASAALS